MNRIIFLIAIILGVHVSTQAQQDAKQLQETAHTFQRQGDYANALLVLNRALQQKPNDLDIQKEIAYTYFLQRDYARAQETIKPLIDRDDADVQTFQIGGNIFKATEEVKASENLYKKGLKKYPNSGALLSEYGELLWAKKDPVAAIELWEKGIEVDPNHSGNYFNACKYYYYAADKVWSLVYGEIFVNLESYSTRTAEIKNVLMEGYKKFFTQSDAFKKYDSKKKTDFEEAFLATMNKQTAMAATGITVENLIMIRSRFILDWFETNARKFPHRLFEYQQQLLKEGMFEAYNQWLFGTVSNVVQYQNWTITHTEEHKQFNYFQHNRVFKMPPGQYYQMKL